MCLLLYDSATTSLGILTCMLRRFITGEVMLSERTEAPCDNFLDSVLSPRPHDELSLFFNDARLSLSDAVFLFFPEAGFT